MEYVVSGLLFVPGGLELSFMCLPNDIRNDGKLMASRTISVSEDHPSYAEQIAELKEQVQDLVRDLFEDFDSAPIADPPEGDDDDDRGMGE